MKSKAKGVLFVIIAAFGFSMMSVFVRLAGNDIPPFQKAFFRNVVALAVVACIMLKRHESFRPKKGSMPYLIGRAVFGTLGVICNFYAIGRLVLADANMLNKLSPFFAIIFSVFFLKEKPKAAQLLGILAAFLGSIFIIKPSFSNPDVFPAVIGMIGGLGAGMAYTFVRKLGMQGENGSLIIFVFSSFSCLICLPFMLFNYVPMTTLQLVYLVCAGISACIGQFGITKAYFFAPAREISVYDYSQVIFAALFGFVLFGQVPDALSVVGYVLICGAGIAMFIYNGRQDEKRLKER